METIFFCSFRSCEKIYLWFVYWLFLSSLVVPFFGVLVDEFIFPFEWIIIMYRRDSRCICRVVLKNQIETVTYFKYPCLCFFFFLSLKGRFNRINFRIIWLCYPTETTEMFLIQVSLPSKLLISQHCNSDFPCGSDVKTIFFSSWSI